MMPGAQVGLELGRFDAARKVTATRRDAPPAGLDPTHLVAWYDPSDPSTVVQSGGKVSRVLDKWGGFDLTQSVAARQPDFRAESPGFLQFGGDALGQSMLCPALAKVIDGTSPYTVMYVFRPFDLGGYDAHFFALGAGSLYLGTFGGSMVQQRTPDSGTIVTDNIGGIPGGNGIAVDLWEGPGGQLINIYVDFNAGIVGGVGTACTADPATCWVGGSPLNGGQNYFNGVLGEIFVFRESALASGNYTTLSNYLRPKWGAY